jgi:beta-phosphoglucomutase
MAKWPLAVFFDFDGVIVNSEPLHFYAFHETLQECGIDLSEEEYYNELIGFDDRGALRYCFEKRGRQLGPKTFLHLMTRKSKVMMELIHQRKFKALPGVEEFVRGIWRHYPLAICSGALREEIETMLEGISLRDCFQTIVAAEDVTEGKPNPEGYLRCTQLVGARIKKRLNPEDCLVIEDAPSVIRSIRARGFKVLGLSTTYGRDKMKEANWVARSLQPAEIRKILPELQMLTD